MRIYSLGNPSVLPRIALQAALSIGIDVLGHYISLTDSIRLS